MIAEQIWPVGKAPGWRNYGMNLLIAFSTVFLSLPLGIAAGLWSAQVRQYLPWKPISFTFHNIAAVPYAGHFLEILAMIFVPLFLHDFWFYWAHRIEHKVPFLWAFHKLHHSDELMNTSTWARDHFLQNSWRAFFSIFTLGMIVDLDLSEAGKAALYSTMFLSASVFVLSLGNPGSPSLARPCVGNTAGASHTPLHRSPALQPEFRRRPAHFRYRLWHLPSPRPGGVFPPPAWERSSLHHDQSGLRSSGRCWRWAICCCQSELAKKFPESLSRRLAVWVLDSRK